MFPKVICPEFSWWKLLFLFFMIWINFQETWLVWRFIQIHPMVVELFFVSLFFHFFSWLLLELRFFELQELYKLQPCKNQGFVWHPWYVSSHNHLLELNTKAFLKLTLTVSILLAVLPALAENHKGSNFSYLLMETLACIVICLQRLHSGSTGVFPSNHAAH